MKELFKGSPTSTSVRSRTALEMIRPNGLKELRIYVLAGKREFVASTQNPDGCGLYSVEAWGTYGNAEYWVDTAGRLLSRGEPTRWSIRDLQDTGRATTYPQSRVV